MGCLWFAATVAACVYLDWRLFEAFGWLVAIAAAVLMLNILAVAQATLGD